MALEWYMYSTLTVKKQEIWPSRMTKANRPTEFKKKKKVTQNATKYDCDRLGTACWFGDSNPTGVDTPVYAIPSSHLIPSLSNELWPSGYDGGLLIWRLCGTGGSNPTVDKIFCNVHLFRVPCSWTGSVQMKSSMKFIRGNMCIERESNFISREVKRIKECALALWRKLFYIWRPSPTHYCLLWIHHWNNLAGTQHRFKNFPKCVQSM